MNSYPVLAVMSENHPSELERSRHAAELYALHMGLREARRARRAHRQRRAPLRRLRQAAARGLVRTARAVDVSDKLPA